MVSQPFRYGGTDEPKNGREGWVLVSVLGELWWRDGDGGGGVGCLQERGRDRFATLWYVDESTS